MSASAIAWSLAGRFFGGFGSGFGGRRARPPREGTDPTRDHAPVGEVRPSATARRDADLLARIRAGDESAFAELIGQYGQILRKFAFVILKDHELAADVVQDIFVRLWARREMLSIDVVADYLFGAVRNRARDVNRHEKSQARVHTLIREQYVINPAAVSEAADAAIVTKEFAAALAAAIDSLTPRVRETFLLSSIRHMTYSEIAAALGVSPATVQSQLSRAMAHILKHLAPFR